MNSYLKVKNWDEFQHYSNRTPPWIKLHNSLLDDYEFELLSDVAKGHLLCIWMLASRTGNKIPNNPQWIKKKIGASSNVDLQTFLDAGFLMLHTGEQDASKVLHNEEQDATNYVPPEEKRREEEKDKRPFFDVFWKNWIHAKKQIGLGGNYGARSDALKKWNTLFGKLSFDEMEKLTDDIVDFTMLVYGDILEADSENRQPKFFNFRNMYPQKFLATKGWENE